jgi:hypothetical protein
MKASTTRQLTVGNGFARTARNANMKCNGHRPSSVTSGWGKNGKQAISQWLVSRSRNTPSARSKSLRWQVSRLAEQGFPYDPCLPDENVSGTRHLSGHGRGGGCF